MRNRNCYRLNKIQGLDWPSGLPKYLSFLHSKRFIEHLVCVRSYSRSWGQNRQQDEPHTCRGGGNSSITSKSVSLPPKKGSLNSQTQFSATQTWNLRVLSGFSLSLVMCYWTKCKIATPGWWWYDHIICLLFNFNTILQIRALILPFWNN